MSRLPQNWRQSFASIHIDQSPFHEAEVLKFTDESNDKVFYDAMNTS